MRAEPVEPKLLPQLPLPLHLVPHGVHRVVCDLAVLLVLLRTHEDALLGLLGQVLAHCGHREHDLLHGAVLADDLDLRRVRRVVGQRLVFLRVLGLDEHAQLLVELGQLVRQDVQVVADLTRRRALALLAACQRCLVSDLRRRLGRDNSGRFFGADGAGQWRGEEWRVRRLVFVVQVGEAGGGGGRRAVAA